jgi:hypothetical protein
MYGCAALDPEPTSLVALATAGSARVATVTARALTVFARPDRIFDFNDVPLSDMSGLLRASAVLLG